MLTRKRKNFDRVFSKRSIALLKTLDMIKTVTSKRMSFFYVVDREMVKKSMNDAKALIAEIEQNILDSQI